MPRAPPAARCIPRAFPFLPPPPGGHGQHRAPPAASAAEGPVGTRTEFRSQGWKKKENTEVVGHLCPSLWVTVAARGQLRCQCDGAGGQLSVINIMAPGPS